jgi:hypothetical protein
MNPHDFLLIFTFECVNRSNLTHNKLLGNLIP